MSVVRKLSRIKPAALRHVLGRNSAPYERILQYITSRSDIWITTQGDYVSWWREREETNLKVTVFADHIQVETSSPRAVIQHFNGQFLNSSTIPWTESDFEGECVLSIDPELKYQHVLIEILKREGILNYQIGGNSELILSGAELESHLEECESVMRHGRRRGRPYEENIQAIRQVVVDVLAGRRLPLLRVWYHPRVDGIVPRAVFSARYDVDRAISNMRQIRALERKYGVDSTLYIRSFCPFYTGTSVRQLADALWCSEIALHGEFATHAQIYGSESGAAIAEKSHLESLIERSVLGVGMHGGELTRNNTPGADIAMKRAGLLYDTTPRPSYYFLPFRKYLDGQFSDSYGFPHALSDIEIPANAAYGEVFYRRTVEMMEYVYERNGVFVLMLHPVYFGLFSYLSRPQNVWMLAKFMTDFLSSKPKRTPLPA